MSEDQTTYRVADEAFASTKAPYVYVPIWKREAKSERCTFENRPAEAPGEPEEQRWECIRTYVLAWQDINRALDDTDIRNLKRVLVERLSAESGGQTTENEWEYRMAFKVWSPLARGDSDLYLTCWLE